MNILERVGISRTYPTNIPKILLTLSLRCHSKMKKYSTSESKELVTLRQRTTKDGGASLYLDYMIDGVRTREFLKM